MYICLRTFEKLNGTMMDTTILPDVNTVRDRKHHKPHYDLIEDEGIDSDLSGNSSSSEQITTPPEEEKIAGDEPRFVYQTVAAVCSEKPCHISFGSSFPTVIYQLRSLQLISVIVQMCVLYMESDRMGFTALLPFLLNILNFYHVGKRLYQNIDGRFDLQQIFRVTSYLLKMRYCYEVFGGLFFSTLAFFTIGEIPSTLSSLLYTISKTTTLLASLVVFIAEVYEVVMLKLGQRPHLLSKQL
uniref:Pecanex-like protein n=1 Tax=Syphacia muris TaxID=451379 RepID=A0A0N5A9R8_9BILA